MGAAAGKTLGHAVAAKVVTGELGARLERGGDELALVTRVLAAGALGWRAFEMRGASSNEFLQSEPKSRGL